MMQISNQDLVFKLKSIGVRVEGDDAHIDTDIIQAILQGKKLPHPREVILRDAPEQPGSPAARRRPAVPQRPPANPLRPGRPRTLIQKVEPRIQNLPMSERSAFQAAQEAHEPEMELEETSSQEVMEAPAALPAEIAAAATAPSPGAPAPASAPGTPATPTTPAIPATSPTSAPAMSPASPAMSPAAPRAPLSPASPGSPSSHPSPSARPPYAPARPGAPGMGNPARPGSSMGAPARPGMGAPGRPGAPSGAPGRPGTNAGSASPASSAAADAARRQRERERIERERKAAKGKPGKGKPAAPRTVSEEDLKTFKGSFKDIEAAEEDLATASGRRRRRVARREGEGDEGGKLLTFKKSAPEGPVMISEGMTLRDFAEKLGVKSGDLIKALFQRGMMANINQVLEPDLAQELANDLGVETMIVSFEEEVQLKAEQEAAGTMTEGQAARRVPRGPVVTIMGHVDHGKTSLLDAIRSSRVTESEFGGITQHIGAYHVDVNGRKIVFIDTPGHEAFTMMRARGAKATDIVVLVVAADDGVMPQTIEAIDHARAAKVPLVVAINKIDKANANLDRVKKELSDRGLVPEDWGGDTVMVPISALKKEGIPELMDMILLTSDLLDLKASPEIPAQGVVLEARKEVGRGTVASVLVQNGTLKVGDVFVSGATWGRVRSMSDDLGVRSKEAGPATPVEVTGFTDVPDAGDIFQVLGDEAQARGIAEFRAQEERRKGLSPSAGRMSLEQLFSRIQEGDVKELPIVLKADVQGSVEVLRDALPKVNTEKVKLNVILSGVGAISTNDVLLASASKAIIVGFNVRPERSAVDLAEKEEVDIRLHTVIYELIDELRKAMTGLLDPTFREVASGRAEVRDTFKVPKVGTIAGCHVIDGVIPRSALIRLLRDNRVIYEGKLASLRRFKDDVSEVRSGFDCGIGIDRFQDVKPGDIIEAYLREEVAGVL
ncbi:MAG: translation initiation factor [Acidobacteriota bacterium]|nr:translation initiation factor [Acidobacteriota bacterium]